MDEYLTKKWVISILFKIFYNATKDEKCTESYYVTLISLYISRPIKELKKINH